MPGKIKKRPISKAAPKARTAKSPLNESVTIKVYDIPIEDIILSDENPNEQDDRTLDALVQSIQKDGFCEPIQVVPFGDKYKMVSGEHRYKAMRLLKAKVIPAVVQKNWDETQRKIGLVKFNQLRGKMNPEKFTKLFNELAKEGVDKELLKANLGFTQQDAFDKVYKSVEKNLPPAQKKMLAEAKENIRSVDDLSSVLNTIFKEHGSELQQGFMVFSFGGKSHHYIQIDGELDKLLSVLEKQCMEKNTDIKEVFRQMLKGYDIVVAAPKAKIKPKPKKK